MICFYATNTHTLYIVELRMQFELLSLLVVLLAGVVTAKDAPVGKCKHPIPGYPHLKISEVPSDVSVGLSLESW